MLSFQICTCILETPNSINYNSIINNGNNYNNNNIFHPPTSPPPPSSWIGYVYSSLSPSITSILTSILNFSLSSSPTLTKCILKLSFYILTISTIHRIIRIFHSATIHFLFNMIIFTSIMMNSSIGHSVIVLIIQIFILNLIIGCIGYYDYKRKKKLFDLPMILFNNGVSSSTSSCHDYYDIDTSNMIQCLKNMIVESNDRLWQIHISSSLFAIILGILSFT